MKIRFSAGFPFVSVTAFFFAIGMFENYLCCLLFSFFHEMGHLLPLIRSGVHIKEISLGAFGVRIVKNKISLSYKMEYITALCGPLVNLIFMLILLSFKRNNEIFNLMFNVNAGLFFINLLPVRMLDGGRILENLLLTNFDELRVYNIMTVSEIITAVFLVLILIFTLIADIVNTSFVFFVLSLVIIIVLSVVKG